MTRDDTQKPELLVPEIFEDHYTADTEDVYTVVYDLAQSTRAMAWNGNMLALAHSTGFSVLTPVPKTAPLAKNLPSALQQEWVFQVSTEKLDAPVTLLRFTSKYVLCALDTGALVLINHLDGSKLSLSKSGADVNDIDVSGDGLVVTCDDDRHLTVYEYGKPVRSITLDKIPTHVKFWVDKDSDKVVLVEEGRAVRVYDWRKDKWLYTVYPLPHAQNSKGYIHDVLVQNDGRLCVVGDGWWKEYDTAQLQGGAGYTFPLNEGVLNGWLQGSKYIASRTASLIGGLEQDRSCFVDMANVGGAQAQQFKLALPSASVPAGAINHNGVVAFASGAKLVLTKPFDSYEAVQY